MDLFQLKYFVTIVEEGSISAAARKLHMTQPPLSHQIKQLEKEFETKLFMRKGRKLIITDTGVALYRRAKGILDLAHVTSKEIDSIAKGVSGVLRIGACSSAGQLKIREKIFEFHQNHPEILFEIHEKNTYSLIDMLLDGRLDVAFVRTPFPQEHFKCINLKEEPLVAVGINRFFDDLEEDVNLDWLSSSQIVIYRRWENLIRNAFHEKGLDFCPLCVCDDVRTCINWALSGFGLALVPQSSLEPSQLYNLEIHKIKDLGIRSHISLIMKNSEYNNMAREFIKTFDSFN